MKINAKVGDEAKVLCGKDAGKTGKILFIDKKNARVRLDGLKKRTVKGKKGDQKLHGTFAYNSLEVLKKEAPAADAPAAE